MGAVRRYDEAVEVRRGPEQGPEQFLWRDRLWQVRGVVAHWVETGPWWHPPERGAATGGRPAGAPAVGDLLAEREVWRVEARRRVTGEELHGVFDLSFDWADGSWPLVGCVD